MRTPFEEASKALIGVEKSMLPNQESVTAMIDVCPEDGLPIPRDSNGDWDWRNDIHRNPKLRRRILLSEEIALLPAKEKVLAENEYADRHEFSSRD